MDCSLRKSPDDHFRSAQKADFNLMLGVQVEKEQSRELFAQEMRKTVTNPFVCCVKNTADISANLKKLKRMEFLEETRRRLLRQDNQELRQLERQLKSAQISKTLFDQRMENKVLKTEELKKQRETNIRTRLERECTAKAMADQERIEREKKAQFRAELLKQIDESTHQRRIECAKLMQEREEMDKMLKKFADKQRLELENLWRSRHIVNQELNNFLQERELEKQLKDIDSAKQLEQEIKYQNNLLAKKALVRKEHQEMMRKKMDISDKIGQDLYNIEEEKRRREATLVNLLVEERKAKEECQYRLQLERQRQQIVNMKDEEIKDRENMRRVSELKKALTAAENVRINKEQIRIQENEDKQKRLTDEHYRLIQKEYAQSIQNMIAENQQKKLNVTTLSVLERDCNIEAERLRLQEIRKERMRMLTKQSPEVLSFLPSNVLQETERKLIKINQRPKQQINSLTNLVGDRD